MKYNNKKKIFIMIKKNKNIISFINMIKKNIMINSIKNNNVERKKNNIIKYINKVKDKFYKKK